MAPTRMRVTRAELDVETLEDVYEHAKFHANRVFLGEPNEHYRLLACLASQCPPGALLANFGTLYGYNALALASGADAGGPPREVITIDARDHIAMHTTDIIGVDLSATPTPKTLPGVRCVVDPDMGLGADRALIERVAREAMIVVVDIDPNDGVRERALIQELVRLGYRGILVLDDIHLNASMKALWDTLSAPVKLDLTHLAHWSGTGVAVMDPEFVTVVAPS